MTWAAPRRAVYSWVMFDWAAQPYFTLITTFIFGPYFVAHFLGDPVLGQTVWGYTVAIAGLGVAFLSPALGAIADAGGPRRPWIFAASVALVIGCAGLWLATPGATYGIWPVILAFAIATLGAEVATVFTNAMLPDIAGPGRVGRLSGLGWAIGYVGGIATLAMMLALFIASPQTGLTLAGIPPLLGLDPTYFEGDRFSGPFSALWYIVFVIPLFLFVPDRARVATPAAAVREGLVAVRATLKRFVGERGPVARYLIARMVYHDGLSTLFAFGGAYAAATFGWRATEVGVYGIILIIAATIGAWVGGYLDDILGSRRLILWSIFIMGLATLAILSVGTGHVLFVFETAPAGSGPLFSSVPELAYILFGSMMGLVAGPAQAASRTLLVHLSPRERLTEYFGLYALAGKATVFVGPLMIGVITGLTGDIRLGFSVILLFFIGGWFLLLTVPDDKPRGGGARAPV